MNWLINPTSFSVYNQSETGKKRKMKEKQDTGGQKVEVVREEKGKKKLSELSVGMFDCAGPRKWWECEF